MKKTLLSESVLNKIKTKAVVQKPRWYFWAQTSLMLMSGLIFFLIGVIASSAVFLLINEIPLTALLRSRSLLKLVFLGFPLIWIILTVLLGFIAVYLGRKTEGGYRVSLDWLFAIAITIQIVGGFQLAQSRWGESVENFVGEKLVQEKSMNDWREKAWGHPQEGLMIGKIETIMPKRLIIRTPKNTTWNIDVSQIKPKDLEDLFVGKKLRLHGKKQANNIFIAERILPGRPFGKETRPPQLPPANNLNHDNNLERFRRR